MIVFDYAQFVHKDFQFLHVRTRPLDYLPGSIVHRASETLNREGNYGFDRLSVLALPKNGAGIPDPGFISRIDELKRRIEEMDRLYSKMTFKY